MQRTTSLPALAGRALLVLAVALACVAIGWAVSRNSLSALFLISAIGGAAMLFVLAELSVTALWLFFPLAVIAYPLSPYLPGEPFVTFDRIWVGALALLLLRLPAAPGMSKASRGFFVALAAFTIVFGIRAALTAGHAEEAIRGWIDALVLPLVVFAVVRRVTAIDEKATEKLALTLVIAGLLLALIGIGQRIFGFELATATGGSVRYDEAIGAVRISGPYPGPEVYALSLVICLAATMYWTLRGGASRYLPGCTIAVIELIAIALTFFRVAWIGAVVVIVLSLVLRPRNVGRGAFIVVMSALVLALSFTGLQRLPAFQERVQNTENIYTRLATYEQGLDVWREAPVFGVGVSNYNERALSLPAAVVHGSRSEPYPHSSFENTLATMGIVGFALLLLVSVRVWRLQHEFKRRARERPDVLLAAATSGALLAYLFFSLTLTMLDYGPSNMFLSALVGMVAGRLDALATARAQEQQAAPDTVWRRPVDDLALSPR